MDVTWQGFLHQENLEQLPAKKSWVYISPCVTLPLSSFDAEQSFLSYASISPSLHRLHMP